MPLLYAVPAAGGMARRRAISWAAFGCGPSSRQADRNDSRLTGTLFKLRVSPRIVPVGFEQERAEATESRSGCHDALCSLCALLFKSSRHREKSVVEHPRTARRIRPSVVRSAQSRFWAPESSFSSGVLRSPCLLAAGSRNRCSRRSTALATKTRLFQKAPRTRSIPSMRLLGAQPRVFQNGRFNMRRWLRETFAGSTPVTGVEAQSQRSRPVLGLPYRAA
jgi:hypothetical protein